MNVFLNSCAIANPLEGVSFDWMHCYFIAGIFNVHMGVLVHALKPLGIQADMLSDYVASYTFPTSVGKSIGATVFGPKRFQASWEAWSLRCTASEGLSILPVLANFMEGISMRPGCNPELARHAACLQLLARSVELLQRSARFHM